MILAIRISGLVHISPNVKETLHRLRLRRKYTAVLIKEGKDVPSLLQTVRNTIAYGTIDNATLLELIKKRGQSIDKKKIDAESIVSQLDKKDLEDLGLKPFFRLHPPIGGIKTKIHFPKGVLGDNKEKINDLVRRML